MSMKEEVVFGNGCVSCPDDGSVVITEGDYIWGS